MHENSSLNVELLVDDVAANLDSILVFGNADTGEVIESVAASDSLGGQFSENVFAGNRYFVQVKSANIFIGDVGQYTLRFTGGAMFADSIPSEPVAQPEILSLEDYLILNGTDSRTVDGKSSSDRTTKTDVVLGKSESLEKVSASDEDSLRNTTRLGYAVLESETGDSVEEGKADAESRSTEPDSRIALIDAVFSKMGRK